MVTFHHDEEITKRTQLCWDVSREMEQVVIKQYFKALIVGVLPDVADWLEAVGYNVDSLVPSVSFDGNIRHSQLQTVQCQQREVTSAFRCAFERDAQTFSPSSHLVAQSSVAAATDADADSDILSFATLPYAFGSGVSVTVGESKLVRVDSSRSSATDLSQLAATLLNGSRVAGVGYTVEGGHSLDYYIKEASSVELLNQYLRAAGLHVDSGGQFDGGRVNVTVLWRGAARRRLLPQDHRFGDDGDDDALADVLVRGEYSTVIVRCTSSTLHRSDTDDYWVIKAAQGRAVETAWDNARQQAADADKRLLSKMTWSRSQREQLLSTSRVSGVKVKYVRSYTVWPEFADDPANIIFSVND